MSGLHISGTDKTDIREAAGTVALLPNVAKVASEEGCFLAGLIELCLAKSYFKQGKAAMFTVLSGGRHGGNATAVATLL